MSTTLSRIRKELYSCEHLCCLLPSQRMLTGRTAVTFRADAVLQADRVISNSCKKGSELALHVREMDPINVALKNS